MPNGAHLHLLVNHLPVLGCMFGTALLGLGLLAGWGDARRVGLAVLAFTALTCLPVYLTGDPAEHTIAGTPGFDRGLVHAHEDMALKASFAAAAAGVLSVVLLLQGRGGHPISREGGFVALALGVVACVLMGLTAERGGEIRHPEVRSGFVAPPPPPRGGPPPSP